MCIHPCVLLHNCIFRDFVPCPRFGDLDALYQPYGGDQPLGHPRKPSCCLEKFYSLTVYLDPKGKCLAGEDGLNLSLKSGEGS